MVNSNPVFQWLKDVEATSPCVFEQISSVLSLWLLIAATHMWWEILYIYIHAHYLELWNPPFHREKLTWDTHEVPEIVIQTAALERTSSNTAAACKFCSCIKLYRLNGDEWNCERNTCSKPSCWSDGELTIHVLFSWVWGHALLTFALSNLSMFFCESKADVSHPRALPKEFKRKLACCRETVGFGEHFLESVSWSGQRNVEHLTISKVFKPWISTDPLPGQKKASTYRMLMSGNIH